MQAAFSERFKAGDWSAPAARLVGIYPTAVGNGEAIFEMEANRSHHNPMGTVHGGILSALADSAMGFAFASTLGPGESFTTVELKINYLRPVFGGHLKATARLIHRGKSIGLVECDVLNGEGKLVAHAVSTCSVLGGEMARGR